MNDNPTNSRTRTAVRAMLARFVMCLGIAFQDAGSLFTKLGTERRPLAAAMFALWLAGGIVTSKLGCPWILARTVGAGFIVMLLALIMLVLVAAGLAMIYLHSLWDRSRKELGRDS